MLTSRNFQPRKVRKFSPDPEAGFTPRNFQPNMLKIKYYIRSFQQYIKTLELEIA